MKQSDASPKDSLENALLGKISGIALDQEIRAIAEQLRLEAIAELRENGEICDDKQRLIDSIRVVPGGRKGEYLVISNGEYGENLEYGTRNSPEKPWFIPALVTVSGSIGTCQHGAIKRALVTARRLHVSR